MNMQKIMLEAMTANDKAIIREANIDFDRLKKCVFPMDGVQNIDTQAIKDKVTKNEPITFEWALQEYYKNDNKDYHRKFLQDLAKGLLTEKTDESMFFSQEDANSLDKYQARYPVLSKLNDGPQVFKWFNMLMGTELGKTALSSTETTFDERGKAQVRPLDNDRAIRDTNEKYLDVTEAHLETIYKFVRRGASLSRDGLLYAAYIGYMFHMFENSRKIKGEATDDDNKTVKMHELLDMPAHTIAKNAADRLPASSIGSLTNKHSYYNLRQRSLRTIDPSRINNSNLSEIYIYPQFTIDVLALTPSTADAFRNVLKNCGYDSIADRLTDLEGDGDNKILDITSKDLIAVLNDPNVIQGCIGAGLNNIFKKWGSSWVSDTGESSLDELLLAKPPEQNSDKRYVQVVPVAKGESLRQANTDREMTGYDMIAESNKDMVIGEGDVVKDPDAEVGGERLSNENVKAISNAFEEAYNELFGNANAKNLKLKSATKLKDRIISKLKALDANNELTVNVIPNIQRLRYGSAREFIAKFWRVVKALNPSAPSRIVYDTFDGKHHDMAITGGIYDTLDNTDFENVISRKVSTGGHTYFLSIPRGIAFVAMQENDDDTIVRTENPNTYCMGLVRDGNPMRYSSVSDLMNSPIGKYGTAVVKYHKVGRVKFDTDEANNSYAKVLEALRHMKEDKQDWNPGPVEGMAGRKGAIRVLQTVISNEFQDPTEQHEIIQPFLGGVGMSVESYDKQSGKFAFESTSSVGGTLIRHLSDMYNLDKTAEDYSEWDVINILKVVSPSSKWNLTDWNFRNVLRADAALNGTSSEFADEDDVDERLRNRRLEGDATRFGAGKYSEDALTYSTDDEGEANFDAESNAEVGGEGIGNENGKAIRKAFDAAYENLFGGADARTLTLEDGRRLKDGIVNKLHEMSANNQLSLNIIPAVQRIEYTSFKDFVNKFWEVADKAVATEPDLSDNSIRMEAFTNDNGAVSDELEPSVKKCLYDFVKNGAYDDTDKKLIPEMGSLMMRYATSSAFENNGLNTSCNRENLASAFNQNFEKDWQMKMDAVAKLQKAASGEDVDMELNKFKVNVAQRDADLYSAIQEKIDNDPDYVSRVADIVAQNANAIVNDLNGVSLDEAAQKVPYVPFDRKAAKWFNDAGNALIDFCLYGTEANTNQSLTKLNTAFGAEGINAMMYRLYKSVPKSCLSIDYGTDSNGIARLNTKTVRELWANELQMLESHYNKNGLRDTLARKGNITFADLEQKIKKTYENGTVGKLFACETGVTSPFTYNKAPLNLNAVKSYFDALMAFAKSYNDIGTYSGPKGTIEKQERTQNTLNNELQKQKVLENKYFESLYTEFTRVYNGLQSNELSPTDESVKQTIAKVMKQVVANPMNVLVNNNARLISAYAYYEELIKAENRSVYQSRKSLGFGVGVDADNEKKLGKQGSLTGRNEVIDKTVSPVELALATVHTDELRKQMNALSKQIDIETAEQDYQKYLSEVGSGNRAVRYANNTELDVANIENLDADGRAKAMLGRFDAIKDDYKLFCNYKLDENGTKPADIAKMGEYRKNELIMLLYKTACDIVNSRSKMPRDAKTFRDKLAAQGEYVKYGSAEIIPQQLMTKFTNLTAELEIADFNAYMDFLGKIKASAAASNVKTPGDDDDGPSSNNDPTKSALNIMRGKEHFAQNSTDKLIDDIISDKPIDMAAAHKLIADMDKKGNPDVGTDITLTGKLGVVNNDAFGDMTITSSVKLRTNDKLVIRANGSVYPRQVKSVDAQQYVGKDNKQHTLYKYTIASIPGLTPTKTNNIPFSRFQSANTLSGFDFGGEKLDAVLAKLNEWHETYDGLGRGGVPADVKEKLHILKELYEGCSGSLLMKSIVAYCVWRASNYNGEFAPRRTLRRVGGYMSDPLMKKYFDTIALDLEELGPNGIKKDPEKYAEILDILPDDFISTAQQFHYDLVTPENVRKGGHEAASNITIASLDMDATNSLKLIVDTLSKWSGYVGADDVKRYLTLKSKPNPNGKPNVDGKFNLSPDDATKLLDMVSPTSVYKSVLDDILKEHNWNIAKPIIEAYKQTTSTPTFDDAIQYLRDNYVTKRVRGVEVKNRDAFANYIKTTLPYNVKQELNIR